MLTFYVTCDVQLFCCFFHFCTFTTISKMFNSYFGHIMHSLHVSSQGTLRYKCLQAPVARKFFLLFLHQLLETNDVKALHHHVILVYRLLAFGTVACTYEIVFWRFLLRSLLFFFLFHPWHCNVLSKDMYIESNYLN